MTLRLDNISKRVGGETHIYPTQLDLEPGLTVLIGQTRAGKTSLLRLMAGLDKPATGRIYMDGVDVTDTPVQQRQVAMVYQQFINYPSLKVYDNIASPLKLSGIGRAEIDRRVREVAAEKWVDGEFQPSTLSRDEQLKEMEWFIKAAEPFKGMDIRVVSETITTHEYESKTLARAFSEITGIKLTHDLIQEGDVIEKLQTQMQSDENIYDAYVNDSDLIGTHFRYQKVVPLSDWMSGEGADVTNPGLDVDDFIGKSFTTGPDGKLYQLPDQQFANLYWFRYDLFTRDDLKTKFKDIYGYDLGVPVDWSAYEDIAEFFTEHVKEIEGKPIWGHMDYGKKDPSLGWRFTDAWLSMAGAGDQGIPNGLPVDEWGIRVEGCRPVGSSVARGGDTNGPAAVCLGCDSMNS